MNETEQKAFDQMRSALEEFTKAWVDCNGYPDTLGEIEALDKANTKTLAALAAKDANECEHCGGTGKVAEHGREESWEETCMHCVQQPTPQAQRLSESERNAIEDYCEMIIGKPAFDAIETAFCSKNGITLTTGETK